MAICASGHLLPTLLSSSLVRHSGKGMPAETTGASFTVSELQRQVAELSDQLRAQREEHDEALQREAAIAEILRVINDPAADLARVFDVLVEKAAKLCTASYGYVW